MQRLWTPALWGRQTSRLRLQGGEVAPASTQVAYFTLVGGKTLDSLDELKKRPPGSRLRIEGGPFSTILGVEIKGTSLDRRTDNCHGNTSVQETEKEVSASLG
jgi:hypothetical protein